MSKAKLSWMLACSSVLALAACGDSGEQGAGGSGGAPGDGGSPSDGGAGGAPSSGGAGGGGGDTANPVAQFYVDFGASRYSQADENAAALDAFLEEDPDAADAAVVRGLAHLWHISEFGRDPSQDPATIFPEASKLMSQFQQARDNNPDDPRVPCWLGLVEIVSGQQISNPELVAQGYATIEEGVEAFPEFNLFCRALAYAPLPASDPDYALAIDAMFETMDLCYGETVDRDNPTIEPWLDQATSEGTKRVCWNDAIAPHNAEGFYLFFGDLLVKSGDSATAEILYANAQLIAEYDQWPYKSILEERLGADLEARGLLYADEDVQNDPPLGGDSGQRGCTYCHASSAAE